MSFIASWRSKQPLYGGWCSIPSGFSFELMAQGGFDWLCIDLEHGGAEAADLIPMLQVASITRTPTFVRVPWNDPGVVMRALDSGAVGVIVPMISTVADAERAAGACRYPPKGYRSWGPMRNALGTSEYTPEVGNSSVLCLVMIETVEGAENVDDILAVPGVDGVFIGPADLALSAGLPPTLDNTDPDHASRMDRIIGACKSRGLVVGLFSGPQTRRWREAGVTMLAVAGDGAQIVSGVRTALQSARA